MEFYTTQRQQGAIDEMNAESCTNTMVFEGDRHGARKPQMGKPRHSDRDSLNQALSIERANFTKPTLKMRS